MKETPRHWLYKILENNRAGFIGKVINLGLILLIFINVISIVVSSEASINLRFQAFFGRLKIFSLIVFTLEYIIRVWVSVENPRII